jgi:hypothetical protein
MRRLFWLALGATVGVVVVRKITRTAQSYTPKGIAASFAGLGDSIRAFLDDVRDAMNEREDELLDALGVNAIARDDTTGGGHS